MLEIGAGAGVHTRRYASTFPTCRVVALEPDRPGVALLRRRLDEAGLGDRVEVRHQDARNVDDRDEFDLVTMNLVLHGTGEGAGLAMSILSPPAHAKAQCRMKAPRIAEI